MTVLTWQCQVCFDNLGGEQDVFEHRRATGHVGAWPLVPGAPGPSSSTAEGRARAREIFLRSRRAR